MGKAQLLDIGSAMKKLRKSKNPAWTQGDLCRATGWDRSYVSLLESNGVKYPRYKTVNRLCKAFGISISDFLKLAICGDDIKLE